MKKNDFLTKSLLLGAFALICAACSNDEVAGIVDEEDAPTFSITLKTPAVGGVTVNNATRAEGETVEDETDEATLKSVDIYLFSKAISNTNTTDAAYSYSGKLSFAATATTGISAWETGESGTITCTGKIPLEAMGKYTRFAIIANDGDVTQPASNSTSLADFMASTQASATVATTNTADVLVGGETDKSFPMSAVINDASKSYLLTAAGNTEIEGNVTLVRNVARIDIRNYATDLTITGVKVVKANSKSYIFSGSGTINVPTSPEAIDELNPLKEYSTLITDGTTAYNSVRTGATQAEIFEANTHRAFYLYEQAANTSGNEAFYVEVSYSVNSKDAEGNATQEATGTVKVPFSVAADGTTTYKPIQRNHLYTIQLGNGTAVLTGELKVTLVVDDWATGEEFEEELTPSEDLQS